jgi:hypothetical protein
MMRMAKVGTALLAVALLFVLALPAKAEVQEHAATYGTIKSVNADQHLMVVTDKDGKDWTYHMAKDARIILPDQSWTNAKLNDLKANQDVGLLWEKTTNDNLRALAVLVRSGRFKDAGISWSTIKGTDTNDNTIKATDVGGKEFTFHLAKGSQLRMNDKQATLNDLKANERAIFIWEKQGTDLRVLAVATPPESDRSK